MREPLFFTEFSIIRQDVVVFSLGEGPSVRARGEFENRLQMHGPGGDAFFFQAADGVIDAREMCANGLRRDGIVLVVGRGLRQILVAEPEDDCGIRDFVAFRSWLARFRALPYNLATLIVVVFHKGPGGVIGDVRHRGLGYVS